MTVSGLTIQAPFPTASRCARAGPRASGPSSQAVTLGAGRAAAPGVGAVAPVLRAGVRHANAPMCVGSSGETATPASSSGSVCTAGRNINCHNKKGLFRRDCTGFARSRTPRRSPGEPPDGRPDRAAARSRREVVPRPDRAVAPAVPGALLQQCRGNVVRRPALSQRPAGDAESLGPAARRSTRDIESIFGTDDGDSLFVPNGGQ